MNTKKKKKFEIELYDEIQVGENIDNIQLQKVVMDHPIIIEAADKKELDEHAERFKLCKQRMKIVRMIDDEDDIKQQKAQDFNAENNAHIQQQPLSAIQQETSVPKSIIAEKPTAFKAKPCKPRYYSISGIDIKDDNGKIYQKQWMRLTDAEAQNFRIVNDSNNKISSMNGKHLEMKKWILVETKDIVDIELENESAEDDKI